MTGQVPSLQTPDRYVLDTNVFITAWRDYYARDFCPGFWECLEHYAREGRLLSIDRVLKEITQPKKLVEWTSGVSDVLFASSADQQVVQVFSEMQQWVLENDQFLPPAKDEFARVADGWTAAFAKVRGAVLITHESFEPNARKRVKLPNVCREFGIVYRNTFDMLRELGIRFDWGDPH